MTPRLVRALAVVSISAATVVPAQAHGQQPATGDSAKPDSTRVYVLSPVIVTGSLVPIRRDRLGFGASVVNRAIIDASATGHATTLLDRLPGVWTDEAAGPGGPTVLRVRGGEEPDTQVLFDGVPINISGGFLDLQGLTLTNVDRIEIVRGPQSALYGSSALAGAVQFITHAGQPGPARFEFAAVAGRATQFGQQAHSALTVSGGSPALRYSAGAGVTYDRGIYELPNDLRTEDVSLRLDATLAARWTATGTVRYVDIASKLPVRDAGVTRVPLDPSQRDGQSRLLASVDLGFAATPHWHHTLTASEYHNNFTYSDMRDSLDVSQYPFFVFNFNFAQTSLYDRQLVQYVGTNNRGDVHGFNVSISYGGEFQREIASDVQTGEFGDATNSFERTSGAAFGEIHGQVGERLSLLAGGRLEHFQGLPSQLLPRAAASVGVVPGLLALRVAAGRAFKAPNLQQQFLDNPFTQPNPNLKPEGSWSWEVGTSTTLPASGLDAYVGFFSQVHYNLIRTVALAGTSKQTNENLGRTRSRGLEVDIDRWWTPQLHTGANLTWVKTEVTDNSGLPANQYPVGSELPAVPGFTAAGFVDIPLPAQMSATLRGSVTGSRVAFSERFSGERIMLDSYTLVGATVRWLVGPRVNLQVVGNNLLNVNYQTAYDRPGVPLRVGFGVLVRS
jgi:vitamin B12 transporter